MNEISEMDYLPVFLDIKDKKCLVIGGKEEAFVKTALLLRAGARVVVVAQSLSSALNELREKSKIEHKPDDFAASDLEHCKLVIVATEHADLRKKVSLAAQNLNVPVNVVDVPELCSFMMPSIVDRSPLIAAISTGGTSPTLARILRSRLEAMLPQSYGSLATLVGVFREKAKQIIAQKDERRLFWNKIFASPIIEMFLSGKEKEAERAIDKELEACKENSQCVGQVCLVGAGPGDPDLLTLRALRLIQNADTVVYDRLVFPSILEYARRDAELIYVGKKSANHIVPQDQINQILVDLAKEGKMVVRLKGGDPFIFGRGGEEVEMLIESGVDFQVVPGVTAASGCSTYAGIPLTHRDYAQHCILVTGHLKDDGTDLNWQGLVKSNQTVVLYMGISNISTISGKLIEHGMSPSMPAAIVQKGTTKNQKVYVGTIAELPGIVANNNVKPPALIIVGEVVSLHHKLTSKNLMRS